MVRNSPLTGIVWTEHGLRGIETEDEAGMAERVIRAGTIEVDAERCEARVRGQAVTLTTGELNLLALLAKQSNELVTYRVMRKRMGAGIDLDDRTLSRRVQRLRKKLGEEGKAILSLPGQGYVLLVPETSPRPHRPAWSWAAWLPFAGWHLTDMRAWLVTWPGKATASSCVLVTLACTLAMILPGRTPGEVVGAGGLMMIPEQVSDRTVPDLSRATPAWVGGLSGLTYVPQTGGYLAVSNRGPHEAPWLGNRLHRLQIEESGSTRWGLRLRQDGDAIPLMDHLGRPWLNRRSHAGRQTERLFDAEAIVALDDGRLVVADEYGPSVQVFDAYGRWLSRFEVPAVYRPGREKGVLDNRGFEGLASVEFRGELRQLLVAPQWPLAQDGGEIGQNVRLLEIDAISGSTRQLVYRLDAPGNSLRELQWVRDDMFLALEQVPDPDEKLFTNWLVIVHISGATDVSDHHRLPESNLPASTRSVSRMRWLRLDDPSLGLDVPLARARFDGFAIGQQLDDGRHELLLITDNLFDPDRPTYLLKLAIRLP